MSRSISMATSAADPPRATDSLHRTTIELGATVGAVTALVYLIWAVSSGEPRQIINGIGPILLTALSLVMLRMKWYHAEVVIIAAAVSTVVSFKFFGQASAASPAMTGIVVIVSIGALFIAESWQWTYVWLATLGLLGTGMYWEGITRDALWTGITGALSALVAMTVLIRIRESAVASDRRYRILVEKVPLPLLEEDWSNIRHWITIRRSQGVTDIEAYLDDHPDDVSALIDSIAIRGFNPAIARLLGTDGTAGSVHPTSHSFSMVRNEIISLWKGQEPSPAEYPLTRADGEELWARVQAVDIDPGLIEGVDRVLVATDVTELKDAQEQLGEQIRSKDEFIAAVSHELRTPLTSILGFADLVESSCTEMDAETSEMMEILLDQAQDMSLIVEDLLVAARAEIGGITINREPVDLAGITKRAMTEAREEFELELNTEPTILADPLRVTQIVRNLVSNASRYGGTRRWVRVSTHEGSGVVEIRDDGDPIPDGIRDRIFEPYARAQTRPGLAASVGLGLSISRQLARLMDGDVTYDRDGNETVFRLTLPLVAAQASTN